MAEFPAMPLWTDALLGDTTHLSATEFGAYMRLLVSMWRNGAWLPSDEKILARYSTLTSGQWKRSRGLLLKFFTFDGDRVTQRRLLKEWVAVERKSKSAKNSANTRWLKTNETRHANASNPQCERNANQTHKSPEADASGADAPSSDLAKIVFGPGLRLLTSNGVPERQARSLLGKWRGQHGDETLLTALGRAQREGALDPVGFIEGCFRANGHRKGKANDRLERGMRLANGFDGRAEADSEVDRGEGDHDALPLLPARSVAGG